MASFVSFVILENFGNGDSHGFDVRAPTGLCTLWASVRLSCPRTSPYRADGRVLCQGPIQVVSTPGAFLESKKLSWSGLCCLVLHGHFAKGTRRVLPHVLPPGADMEWVRASRAPVRLLVAATGVLCDPTISGQVLGHAHPF